MVSIWMRDNMNYQEYNWGNAVNPSTSSSSSSSDPWAGGIDYGTCVGDSCCSNGLVYDTSMNQCVTSSSSSSSGTTETFITESMVNINNVLTKKQPGNFKDSVNLRQPNAYNN
jgi:hypothetical protein